MKKLLIIICAIYFSQLALCQGIVFERKQFDSGNGNSSNLMPPPDYQISQKAYINAYCVDKINNEIKPITIAILYIIDEARGNHKVSVIGCFNNDGSLNKFRETQARKTDARDYQYGKYFQYYIFLNIYGEVYFNLF